MKVLRWLLALNIYVVNIQNTADVFTLLMVRLLYTDILLFPDEYTAV